MNSLGTVCEDFALARVLLFVKNFVNLIQIVVPILLMLFVSIQLIKMVRDPELKNGTKKIHNMIIAAVCVFFMPMFINYLAGILETNFNLAACWNEAESITNYMSSNPNYVSVDDKEKHSILIDEKDYEKGVPKPKEETNTGSNSSNYVPGTYSKDVEAYMTAVKNVVAEARAGNYHYGDSHAMPPTTDKKISCDRLEAKALYDIGYTDQRTGGEVCSTLDEYLTSHGWIKSTNINDVKYGSIVLVSHNGTAGPVYHAFTSGGYDSNTGVMIHYDEGAEWRIHSEQPFETTYYTQDLIYGVYNMK